RVAYGLDGNRAAHERSTLQSRTSVRKRDLKREPAMSEKMSRREFVVTGTVGLAAAAQAPTMMTRKAVKPGVIAAANGNIYKNGGTVTGVEKAFAMMTSGADVLESLVAGVNIVELDPKDNSVGYGGLPNADGVVQLDACCMHGPKRRAGGVAA